MTTSFDYTKLIVENINKIIPAVLLLVTGLTSAFGYVVSDNWNNEEEKTQAVREVTEGFQSIIETEHVLVDKEKPKTVVHKSSCGDCLNRINGAIKKHEKGRLH